LNSFFCEFQKQLKEIGRDRPLISLLICNLSGHSKTLPSETPSRRVGCAFSDHNSADKGLPVKNCVFWGPGEGGAPGWARRSRINRWGFVTGEEPRAGTRTDGRVGEGRASGEETERTVLVLFSSYMQLARWPCFSLLYLCLRKGMDTASGIPTHRLSLEIFSGDQVFPVVSGSNNPKNLSLHSASQRDCREGTREVR
jgi:hypothetical protein